LKAFFLTLEGAKDSQMAAVLLVEDTQTVRMVLRAFLEAGGHGVTECSGGEEASRLMKNDRFEVVVTDLCMKDGDGLAFIREQRSKGATIPIVAITGGEPRLSQSKGSHLALRAGANRVLAKPVTKPEILGAVAAAIASLA
jgi:CheY-like chemotaxis protein